MLKRIEISKSGYNYITEKNWKNYMWTLFILNRAYMPVGWSLVLMVVATIGYINTYSPLTEGYDTTVYICAMLFLAFIAIVVIWYQTGKFWREFLARNWDMRGSQDVLIEIISHTHGNAWYKTLVGTKVKVNEFSPSQYIAEDGFIDVHDARVLYNKKWETGK